MARETFKTIYTIYLTLPIVPLLQPLPLPSKAPCFNAGSGVYLINCALACAKGLWAQQRAEPSFLTDPLAGKTRLIIQGFLKASTENSTKPSFLSPGKLAMHLYLCKACAKKAIPADGQTLLPNYLSSPKMPRAYFR
jgi:hypothetical protein